MKKNLPITQKENDYHKDLVIVSTTDKKGVITHVNHDFIEIAGFNEQELLGSSHNIVRHPEMPPAAFADLWSTVKAGKPWMGMVKNRCKNGDYYWVDAFVTPIIENNTITGYQSVRKKPERRWVKRAQAAYQKMLNGSGWSAPLLAWLPHKMLSRFALANGLSTVAIFLLTQWLLSGTTATFAFIIMTLISSLLVNALLSKPWREAAQESQNHLDNALANHIYSGRNDELGQLQTVIKLQQSQQATILYRLSDAASNLNSVAMESSKSTAQTVNDMEHQKLEIEQIVTAITEMSATITDVAKNANDTAQATAETNAKVQEGKTIVEQTVEEINTLAKRVDESGKVIEQLEQVSQNISKVVDVIRGIAEQTNLLALNAAIEAARAGEQGRGFAVVADEVRTLASRTQSSTEEIQHMIESLIDTTNKAATTMEQGKRSATSSVERAEKAGQALNEIAASVVQIMDMNQQIATAAEEQSTVTDGINNGILAINETAEKTLNSTMVASQSTQKLNQEIQRLQTVVKQFKPN
ncbi:MAG: methyl-accepting chemotaxis protein [Gammaproteobacteria bacterium]|nr:methyl-accepting chemotaxis protein [Gammaproteobacteria bacterium]